MAITIDQLSTINVDTFAEVKFMPLSILVFAAAAI